MLIDSHAHLTSLKEEDLDGVLERAQAAGIGAIVNICTHPSELAKGLALASKHPWIYNAAATTPHGAAQEGEACFPIFAEAARGKRLAAIGETGLDYHYYQETVDVQKTLLRKYIRLALECRLPLVIHCREAFSDFFQILDEESAVFGRQPPGVLHCFTGTLEEAHEVIKRGWYLSLSGIVTFKKSDLLREVAKQVPLDQLLIETDTPYLAPSPMRAKQNEPAFLLHTARCIAEVRGISIIELGQATSYNTKALFSLLT